MNPNPRFIKYTAFAISLILVSAMLFSCAPKQQNATPAPQSEAPATESPLPAKPTEAPALTPDTTVSLQVVPEFSSIDLEGNTADSTVFQNADFTFVNIWGTFCGPCINEMPDLGELSKEYADKGVQFIGIVSDATADTPDEIELAKEIRDYTGADYLHILVSESVYTAMLTNVSAIPTTFIVNSKGEIVSDTLIGSRSKGDWKTFIDDTIKEQD